MIQKPWMFTGNAQEFEILCREYDNIILFILDANNLYKSYGSGSLYQGYLAKYHDFGSGAFIETYLNDLIESGKERPSERELFEMFSDHWRAYLLWRNTELRKHDISMPQ
ncbi:hypothetical protein [Polystyrenella longa]|nr:hypothetical protein [Polystyrenella longa]